MTEECDDINFHVAERVAALSFDADRPRDVWREKAKAACNLRSQLVHGSISPRSLKVIQGVQNAAEVAETALPRAIESFGIESFSVKMPEIALKPLMTCLEGVMNRILEEQVGPSKFRH